MPKYKHHQSMRHNPSVAKKINITTMAFAGLAGLTSLLSCPAQAADTAEVKIDVNVSTVLSLAVYPHDDHTAEADHLSLGEAIPGGNLVYNSLDLVVRTNVESGYQLSMIDMDDNTSMQNMDGEGEIVTLTESVKPASFPDNHWGFAIGEYSSDAVFLGVPAASDAPAKLSASETLVPNEGETTVVTFATKVNSEMEQGRYEDTVIFTVSPELVPEEPEEPEDITGLKEMQDMTSAICNATPTPAINDTTVPEATLTDSRDGKTYKVRKLADGKCWMVQDLNYNLNASKALLSETSDITSDWIPNNTTQTSTGTTWETPSPTTARSYTNGTRTYYNWYAATAGTTNASTVSGNATGSVCPKGWTLPTPSDFDNLFFTTYNIGYSSAGSAKLRSAPFSFGYTGFYDYSVGSLQLGETYGDYWSSRADAFDKARYIYFTSSGVFPQYNNYRGNGLAVRCVAK